MAVAATVTVAVVASVIEIVVVLLAGIVEMVAKGLSVDVRLIVTFSVPSTIKSVLTGTVMIPVVAPSGIIILPDNGVRSTPEVAVPPTV